MSISVPKMMVFREYKICIGNSGMNNEIRTGLTIKLYAINKTTETEHHKHLNCSNGETNSAG